MKIINVIAHGTGFIAHTESGELYFGFFVSTSADNSTVPKVAWRLIPGIPDNAIAYELNDEPVISPKLSLLET